MMATTEQNIERAKIEKRLSIIGEQANIFSLCGTHDYKEMTEIFQDMIIVLALKKNGYNRARTAEYLGLSSRSVINSRCEKFGYDTKKLKHNIAFER